MGMKKIYLHHIAALAVLLAAALALSGCGFLGLFRPDREPTPIPTVTPTLPGVPTIAPPTTTPVPAYTATPQPCTNRASFDADVTVPDGTAFAPGAAFTKTWRLRNEGTCTWDSTYALVFTGGYIMDGPPAQQLVGTAAPGATIDVSVSLIAPSAVGTYRGEWHLRSPDGVIFGLGERGDRPFWVEIAVRPPVSPTPVPPAATATPIPPTPTATPPASITPTPAPAITDWRGEYYRTIDLSGPALVRNDTKVQFNWGGSAPDTSLPADSFSARWTRTLSFGAGLYRFHADADDGVRVWVDSTRLINKWEDGVHSQQADYVLLAGEHSIKVEYFEHTGAASIHVWWERLEPTSFPDWRGQYWANRGLNGDPVFARNDAELDFAWGEGAAAPGMPADSFSARWTRTRSFNAGLYRFHALVDDGIRVWVDDRLVIDSWRDGSIREVTGDVTLTSGDHKIKVEYYERTGEARARVWWNRISQPVPTPTVRPTNTPTPTPTRTPTPTATPQGAPSISGRVWHDECPLTGQPASGALILPVGCVIGPDGNWQANGIHETGEQGIAEVTVGLARGACPAAALPSTWYRTAVTDRNGGYTFQRLTAGTYCVAVPLSNPRNAALLLPGLWTYPNAMAAATVTVRAGEAVTKTHFGWDYLLLPIVETPTPGGGQVVPPGEGVSPPATPGAAFSGPIQN